MLVVGGMHNAVIIEEHGKKKVYTWGCNDDGILGREGPEEFAAEVNALADKDIVQISTGDYHMTALSSSGKLYTWGSYKDRQAFIGFKNNRIKQKQPVPELFDETDQKIVSVASGENSTIILTDHGDVYEWGDVRLECTTHHKQRLLIPRTVVFQKVKIKSIFAGGYHNFAIDLNHDVYSWGLNNYGQLGFDDTKNRYQPRRIKELRGKEIVQCACGQHHSVVLSKTGKVYSFGKNSYGQLGHGNNTDQATPKLIEFFEKLKGDEGFVTQIDCGGQHSLALTKAFKAYTWGFGSCLQLGNGTDSDELLPYHVTSQLLEGKKVIAVGGGGQHSAFIIEDTKPKKTTEEKTKKTTEKERTKKTTEKERTKKNTEKERTKKKD